MPFPPSPNSAQLLISLERTITRERLGRYLTATSQNLANAVLLYEMNVALSEVLYGLLHGFEVTARNAMHDALAAGYTRPDWYDLAPLPPYWQQEIVKAKTRLQRIRRGTPPPGKVVAELTFGFWVDLLSNANHNTLWMGMKLRAAFRNAVIPRPAIHRRLKDIQRLRNRISHHERILTTRQKLYTGHGFLTLPELVEPVGWISTDTETWLKTRFRYNTAASILSGAVATGVHL